MKWFFLGAFALLIAATAGLYTSRTAVVSNGGPIIYLIGSPSPDNASGIELFQQWLKKSDLPPVDLRIDVGNSDPTKVIIQGISGIGSDLIPSYYGANMQYLQAMGLLKDLTPVAGPGGFGPDTFTPVARDEVIVNGRQYAYPTLLYVLMDYANVGTFEQVGMAPPPERMTFDQFEAIGKEFVAKANPSGQHTRRFFCSAVSPLTMRRSLGLDTFNETLTRCVLDDPRNAEVLKLIRKWTEEERLIPDAADMASFTTDGSTASAFGPRIYQFRIGNIAMIDGGSYLTPTFRQWSDLKLEVCEPAYGEFPNAIFGATMLSVYAGSKHPDAACTYLRYLASQDYAKWVIDTGSGIPANTEAMHSAEYLHPADHPDEGPNNARFADAIEQIGVPYTACPYVLNSIYVRLDGEACDHYTAGLCTAEEASQQAARNINEEIDETLKEQPELRAPYEAMVARQKEIDARRQRGEKVPLAWIANPFYRQYYQFMKWAE